MLEGKRYTPFKLLTVLHYTFLTAIRKRESYSIRMCCTDYQNSAIFVLYEGKISSYAL